MRNDFWERFPRSHNLSRLLQFCRNYNSSCSRTYSRPCVLLAPFKTTMEKSSLFCFSEAAETKRPQLRSSAVFAQHDNSYRGKSAANRVTALCPFICSHCTHCLVTANKLISNNEVTLPICCSSQAQSRKLWLPTSSSGSQVQAQA